MKERWKESGEGEEGSRRDEQRWVEERQAREEWKWGKLSNPIFRMADQDFSPRVSGWNRLSLSWFLGMALGLFEWECHKMMVMVWWILDVDKDKMSQIEEHSPSMEVLNSHFCQKNEKWKTQFSNKYEWFQLPSWPSGSDMYVIHSDNTS
jgi:hypothetical protein